MAKKKNHKPGSSPPPSRLLVPAAALLIIVFTFITYAPALRAPFIFDDQINITGNPYIRIQSLAPDQLQRAMVQDQFQLRPLSNLSFALDYYFHGLDPRWMHGENAALHALNVLVLFLVLSELIGRLHQSPAAARFTASLLPALAWGAHPANCQAVTYLVQRQTGLAVLGTLAAFLAYLKGRRSDASARAAWFALCALGLIVAAGSKEIGWTAPALIVMAEVLLLRPLDSRPLSVRFLAVMAGGLFTLGLVAAGLLYLTGLLSAYLGSYRDLGYGPVERLLTECRVMVDYVAAMFFPSLSRLALDQEVLVSRSLFDPLTTLPAVAAVVLALGGSLALAKRKPLAAFMGLGFFLSLSLESTVIPVELMYDHRLYFASLFVVPPLLAWAALRAGPRRAAIILALAVVMLGALTYQRNLAWTSVESIWRDSARKSPGLVRPWSNLCAAQARTAPRRALTACGRAVALDPTESSPYINQGVALMVLGRSQEAGAAFEEAVKRNPDDAEAHYNLGAFRETEGDGEGALAEYGRALELDQLNRRARHHRARLLLQSGKTKEALGEWELLTRMYPDDQAAWTWLGLAALKLGGRPRAAQALDQARRLGPPTPETRMLADGLRTSSGAP